MYTLLYIVKQNVLIIDDLCDAATIKTLDITLPPVYVHDIYLMNF